MSRIFERPEDMSTTGKLRLLVQGDGDVIVAVSDQEGRMIDIEFCTPGSGGGRSPKTWKALHALAQAMRDDSAPSEPETNSQETPDVRG